MNHFSFGETLNLFSSCLMLLAKNGSFIDKKNSLRGLEITLILLYEVHAIRKEQNARIGNL